MTGWKIQHFEKEMIYLQMVVFALSSSWVEFTHLKHVLIKLDHLEGVWNHRYSQRSLEDEKIAFLLGCPRKLVNGY